MNNLYKICPSPQSVNSSCPSSEVPSSVYIIMNNLHGMSTLFNNANFSGCIYLVSIAKHQEGAFGSSSLECTKNIIWEKKTIVGVKKKSDEFDFTSDKSKILYEDKIEKELLEIINDFKNNVHSISQVEQLVEEWKNRNDVQRSFREKQKQLNEMRLKYEKIQQDMKNDMRKATPIERFKKIFFTSKSKHSCDSMSAIDLDSSVIYSTRRPISSSSSFSLQSMSSKY